MQIFAAQKYIFILTNSLNHFYINNRNSLLIHSVGLSFFLPTAAVNSKTQNQDDKRTRQSKSLPFVSKKLCHPSLELIVLVREFPCRYKPIAVFILFIKYVFNQSIMLCVIYHCSMFFKFFLQVNFHL